jgi:dTDP-D-glucose 4,6-dehydratase
MKVMNELRNTTIFVTGGAGFIGSAVCRYLLDETEAFVVNIDKLTYSSGGRSLALCIRESRHLRWSRSTASFRPIRAASGDESGR